MLVDEITITLKAGHGGAGRVSFYNFPEKGPDGGDGGKGGNIYIEIVSDLMVLSRYVTKKLISAQNGEFGGKRRSNGKAGQDTLIQLPVGSEIRDEQDNVLFDFKSAGEKILFCKGGLGGKGNYEFRSSKNTTPMYAQPGLEGEVKKVKIILKLIAEYGLIGLPNAGKSSLLNEITGTSVKTADYPFTTLEPNLGVFEGRILADIPGLIEGASDGKGLGLKFLKHIEKTKLLLHCVAADSEDHLRDYKTVRQEMKHFSTELTGKKETILLTKSDTVTPDRLAEIKKKFARSRKKVIPVSIYDFDSIQALKKLLFPSTVE